MFYFTIRSISGFPSTKIRTVLLLDQILEKNKAFGKKVFHLVLISSSSVKILPASSLRTLILGDGLFASSRVFVHVFAVGWAVSLNINISISGVFCFVLAHLFLDVSIIEFTSVIFKSKRPLEHCWLPVWRFHWITKVTSSLFWIWMFLLYLWLSSWHVHSSSGLLSSVLFAVDFWNWFATWILYWDDFKDVKTNQRSWLVSTKQWQSPVTAGEPAVEFCSCPLIICLWFIESCWLCLTL